MVVTPCIYNLAEPLTVHMQRVSEKKNDRENLHHTPYK